MLEYLIETLSGTICPTKLRWLHTHTHALAHTCGWNCVFHYFLRQAITRFVAQTDAILQWDPWWLTQHRGRLLCEEKELACSRCPPQPRHAWRTSDAHHVRRTANAWCTCSSCLATATSHSNAISRIKTCNSSCIAHFKKPLRKQFPEKTTHIPVAGQWLQFWLHWYKNTLKIFLFQHQNYAI